MKAIEKLAGYLSRVPGIGPRSARRMVYHFLQSDLSYNEQLGAAIATIKSHVRFCERCGAYTDTTLCAICADTSRDHTIICVVEQPKDVIALESPHEYRGVYHVLRGIISPIDGIGPDDLRIADLIQRIEREDIREIVLATNPTVEGDTTALYIVKLVTPYNIKTTRLALGLPMNSDLEYTDRLTIMRALHGRTMLEL